MIAIPRKLRENASKTAERAEWLRRLPDLVGELATNWELRIGEPFDSDDVSAAWVAPATRANGECGVLKLGMPHMEGAQEIDGLRFWAGDPVVRLLESDDEAGAMLLERCIPGTSLRDRTAAEQDRVVAGLLRRLWQPRGALDAFRHLSRMIEAWSAESRARADEWPDGALVEEGLAIMRELSRPADRDVLLGTDVHAGNVLRAERAPWLVIDPKPFVGDPAYDATQHLINCADRVITDPRRTINAFAEQLQVDSQRIRAWLFARAAAEPRDSWSERSLRLARALSHG
ncbi:MAG TPA: aminoglycoside phosphotransferase family protein [Gemmatimonadaceae bacterium]|nr:aminoglycoside phosphotransferase family protein [Gemmatimonadaceae bacterium]